MSVLCDNCRQPSRNGILVGNRLVCGQCRCHNFPCRSARAAGDALYCTQCREEITTAAWLAYLSGHHAEEYYLPFQVSDLRAVVERIEAADALLERADEVIEILLGDGEHKGASKWCGDLADYFNKYDEPVEP